MTSQAERKARQRAREKELGLIYVTVRVRKEDKERLKEFARKLNERVDG